MQEDIKAAGWQWREIVFNDGALDDCYVVFTKSTSPTYFTDYPLGDRGWGRYNRMTAWSMAWDSLILNKGSDT